MKRVKQMFFALLTLMLVSVGVASAQEEAKSSKYEESVFASFAKFYSSGIDEKLYLQTDKPYYSAGDQIWFKGYLLSSITHAPLRISNFIYVELLDDKGDLMSRVKVKRDSTGFNGYMNLDPQMEAADYTLRAYTRWQTNMSPQYLFTKNLEIVSPITATKDGEGEIVNMPNKPIAEKALNKRVKAIDYDLQFFPEGGMLLPNVPQIVAFKAIGEDGLSVDIEGEYYSTTKGLIGKLNSTHAGMGLISLIPSPGEQYYVNVKSMGGVERKFNLPAVDLEGVTLKVSKVGDRFYFQSLTTDEGLLQDTHIIIQSRGQVISIVDGNVSGARYIEESSLLDGVGVISLVDANNNVMSERVIFKRPDELPAMTIVGDKSDYARREKASVTISVRGLNGEPAQGEFGVSVTDHASVEIDPAKGDLLSYLLLSSEIKGHVENPGLYFVENSAEEERNLDLLMRTQAWSRFDLSDVLKNRLPFRKIHYEVDTQIAGDVKGFFGNKARRPKVYVFSPETRYMDMFELDDRSAFNLIGLDIPDSTTYIIQARGRSGGNTLTLNILPEEFPASHPVVFDRSEEGVVPMSFVNQSQEKFIYDGGMNVINLEAVTVTTEIESANEYGFSSTHSMRREDLENLPSLSLRSVIQRYPNMQISSEGVMYRGGPSYARFIIDGVDAEFSEVEMMTTDDVEQLDFFTGSEASMFYDASGGIFAITTRMDYSSPVVLPANIAHVNRLGYQRAATFYQPRYEVASLRANLPPDYRTTIYWDGSLVPDESGEMRFEFYTADRASTYDVTVEGVTSTGEICKGSATITRTLAR